MNMSVFGIDLNILSEDQRCIFPVHQESCPQLSFRMTALSLEMMRMKTAGRGV
jgi:hypothetical protein